MTQWLCPERHCSIALAWDPETITEKEIVEKGEAVFKSGAIRRVCGICSGELHVETGVTKFQTMREARPKMFALQQANLTAMRILQMRKN